MQWNTAFSFTLPGLALSLLRIQNNVTLILGERQAKVSPFMCFLFQTSNGGLVMVSFYNVFIACNETASIEDVIGKSTHARTQTFSLSTKHNVRLQANKWNADEFIPLLLLKTVPCEHMLQIETRRTHGERWQEHDRKRLLKFLFLLLSPLSSVCYFQLISNTYAKSQEIGRASCRERV